MLSRSLLAFLIIAVGFAYLSILAGTKGQERLSGASNIIALGIWFGVASVLILDLQ